jgi:hypothetical protein
MRGVPKGDRQARAVWVGMVGQTQPRKSLLFGGFLGRVRGADTVGNGNREVAVAWVAFLHFANYASQKMATLSALIPMRGKGKMAKLYLLR